MLTDEARSYLAQRGLVRAEVIEEAGLDEQEGFLKIRWCDAQGAELYHKLRSMNGEKRYRNPKGTERPALFATPRAFGWSAPALVESELDALLAFQAGQPAFATAGTWRDEAVAILTEHAEEVVLVPDADDAGRRWRDQAVEALEGKLKLFEVELPDGVKDLGDVAAGADDPVTAVAAVLDNFKPIKPEPEPDVDRFLSGDNQEYRWIVPDVIEAEDRLLLTGREGSGKSLFLEQVVVQLAARIHPFASEPIKAVRSVLVDLENPAHELRRRLRALRLQAGERLEPDTLFINSRPEGLDLGADEDDREWLRQRLARTHADLLVIGPVYKMADGDPNSESDIKPVVTFLDELRVEFGVAIVLEAHMTHEGKGRPYGWSGWRRWPEIGIELRESGQFVHWRTPRHETPGIPPALQRGGEWPLTVATRPRDVLWARIVEYVAQSLTRPSIRDLATSFGVSVGLIHKTINEHREEWDGMNTGVNG